MDQHQLLIGTGTYFLDLFSTDYPYGGNSIIQFLWDQNTNHKTTLKVQGAWNQRLLENIDKISSVIHRPEVLDQLNNIILYLKILRLVT